MLLDELEQQESFLSACPWLSLPSLHRISVRDFRKLLFPMKNEHLRNKEIKCLTNR